MSNIVVNSFVRGYVEQIFINKGYDPVLDEEISKTFEAQWDHWKRFMVQAGLNADEHFAENVAYEFATKRLVGGAARIFEHFADFVRNRPKAVAQHEIANQKGYESEECQYCDGIGCVSVPVEYKEQTSNRSFACVCNNALKYAGVQVANSEMLRYVLQKQRQREQHLLMWCEARGLDMFGDLAEYNAKAKSYRDSLGELFKSARPEDMDKAEREALKAKRAKEAMAAVVIESQVEMFRRKQVVEVAVSQPWAVPVEDEEMFLMSI
jgi:hypothetical protein